MLGGTLADESAKAKKRPAAAPLDAAQVIQGIDWKGLARSGDLNRCTVERLKVYCKHYGLPTGGRKADLVARVAENELK